MTTRIRYTKQGKVRFLGHRDLARCWERALRKADLRVEYSQGFSPRPKMHFGLALSNGAESLAEYVEVDFVDPPNLESLCGLLTSCLPIGVECTAAAPVVAGSVSLQEQVDSCEWRIGLIGVDRLVVQQRVDELLAAHELILNVQRKGKGIDVDLRPQLWSLAVENSAEITKNEITKSSGDSLRGSDVNDRVDLLAELATKPRGIRPDELVRVLVPDSVRTRVTRLAQWTMTDEGRIEPIPLVAAGNKRSSDPSAQRTLGAFAR